MEYLPSALYLYRFRKWEREDKEFQRTTHKHMSKSPHTITRTQPPFLYDRAYLLPMAQGLKDIHLPQHMALPRLDEANEWCFVTLTHNHWNHTKPLTEDTMWPPIWCFNGHTGPKLSNMVTIWLLADKNKEKKRRRRQKQLQLSLPPPPHHQKTSSMCIISQHLAQTNNHRQ